ncbi:regulatory protein NosR [Roseobacter denitrificans]|uniref:Nitrous-oxide reductase regulatory protein NosR n=1 Tax=Roseobacter denitrificans (strain ATCC 33942 / OCh 114) TaxID=375451 RepID=Q16A18_ROSDO|nr:NosR/NirI family protein [Roseobacter denitrificans]ABG31175.1 nitrous-oxide reductase regulatory protein NosR [Roseobacter denitrificans OCh 114]AVL54234.1 regulatory protein NosR [Roseobacter denitrificans]SFF97594.1 NosR/NirI family transcriptional regulator, nitrous oxide reductase regulator [Roseobacter denitrificans OCh 114]
MQLARNLILICALLLLGVLGAARTASAETLASFLPDLAATDFAADADGFGAIDPDTKVAPILRGGETLGYVFLTSDFVGTTGYSGKPIHVVAAIDLDANVMAAHLVKHSEPIVLIGIPDSKVKAVTEGYRGLDLKAEVQAGGAGHDLDIISGATVTIMVIDDSIVRAGIKVARMLSLGGLSVEVALPKREIDRSSTATADWMTLTGDGSVRTLALDVGQVNRAFEQGGDEKAAARPEPGAPEDTFIEMTAALVSIPEIGRSLLGEAEYANLTDWLDEGEEAILVTGRGKYSFKGSGYVRGGIFDRIQLIQGDRALRFFDRDHKRLGRLDPADAPAFTELDIFKIPVDAEFDPAEPWRLQLLVQRATGAVTKAFVTVDLGYQLPERFIKQAPVVHPAVEDEAAAKTALWQRVWRDKQVEIGVLIAMLLTLSAIFFFQKQFTRNARVFYWVRIGFLTITLLFLGWMTNAQLSVVNLLALGGALRSGFSWDAFLLDPLVFIQWFAIAAALLFWGRGAYCGWLCPFGALQELSNKIARAVKVPQFELPWGLHERLWPMKYMIFLGLFAVSLASLPRAEALAEVEPFKTAIILKFAREWPFVVFALSMLFIGLFIERFYCRYVCPLGAALAIPARMRMFDWLKRYRECGNPCHTCANECPVQAIHPTGEINPNECVNCLHCQVLYQSDAKCPVIIKQLKRRAKASAGTEALEAFSTKPRVLEKT